MKEIFYALMMYACTETHMYTCMHIRTHTCTHMHMLVDIQPITHTDMLTYQPIQSGQVHQWLPQQQMLKQNLKFCKWYKFTRNTLHKTSSMYVHTYIRTYVSTYISMYAYTWYSRTCLVCTSKGRQNQYFFQRYSLSGQIYVLYV